MVSFVAFVYIVLKAPLRIIFCAVVFFGAFVEYCLIEDELDESSEDGDEFF